jgi:hypothetical protein
MHTIIYCDLRFFEHSQEVHSQSIGMNISACWIVDSHTKV